MKAPTLQSTDLLRMMQSNGTRRAIKIVNLLLVIWIAWLLATMTWSVLGESEPSETDLPAAVPTTPRVNQQEELVRQLPNWHLFGQVATEEHATALAVIG